MIFFRRKAPPALDSSEAGDTEVEHAVGSPDEEVDAGTGAGVEAAGQDAGDDEERAWRRRAEAVIPGGASTGSKRAAALYGAADESGPTHFIRASGCRIYTAGGRELIDCTMALGAVALGYGEHVVSHSVAEAVAAGPVSGLSSVREVELAERLTEVIPCAEQVRFLKTGAEAVSAAVRIARAHTGRTHVIGCGYFGWHDWASEADGVPVAVRELYTAVPFDDVYALEAAVRTSRDDLAAIVLEPVIEAMPSAEWMQAARRACDATGAVLVFDEVKTGFRVHTGGYQAYAGVTPELAVFGKAMANGYPLSAVVGRSDVMAAASRTWISSTLAGEATAIAAAMAVLDWHERGDVCEALWSIGGEMRAAVDSAIASSGMDGVQTAGIDPMWLLRFDDAERESRFLALARDEGVLFKRGAYNFACTAHDEAAIARIERAASHAFVALREEEGR